MSRALSAIALSIGIAGCEQVAREDPTAPASGDIVVVAGVGLPGGQKCATLTISPSAATTAIGGVVSLTPTAFNKKGLVIAGAAVTWASQNHNIAAVSSTGLVTGVAPGSVAIIATCAGTGVTASSSITVVP